ncbi:MAG TPA: transposase [Gemmataceae bacterium]|jgi:transposase|nr:transposase [Gemmataceae bacterium]
MNAREERGLVIAATQKLVQKGKVWQVPSQSGRGKYTVCPDPDSPFCSCPDHEETGGLCKHLYAVQYTTAREHAKDGTIVETKTLTITEKKTYTQNWPLYNLAQIEEKRRFLVLLHDLCRGLADPPQSGAGRRRTPMADMIFAAALKIYTTFSSRRFGTDLEEAHGRGFLSHKLHPVMVCTFLESPLLTPVLKDLITVSSLPLKAVETVFAPDSTGFSTSRFVRWFDEKYGTVRSGRDWVKAHAMCGVKTHVVTAVEILDRDAGDCPQFKPLVEKTAENFTVNEVAADKAYLSHENLELVAGLGGTAFIPFKCNSTSGEAGSLWEKLYLYYQLHREQFGSHYHQRSNAESTFSMIKAKFRDNVRSKTDTAMKNEVLCKILCHNVCCLIMSQLELGIEPVFWGERPAEAVAIPAPAVPSVALPCRMVCAGA